MLLMLLRTSRRYELLGVWLIAEMILRREKLFQLRIKCLEIGVLGECLEVVLYQALDLR